MWHLFWANLKMHGRNKQALFWNLMFPLIFTAIFGMFFGRGSTATGTVAVVQQSSSKLAVELEKIMTDTDAFRVQKETNIDEAKELLKKGKIVAVVVVPENFGRLAVVNAVDSTSAVDDGAGSETDVTVAAGAADAGGAIVNTASTKIRLINDPANLQANAVVKSFLQNFLTAVNFEVQQVQPLYGVEEEATSTLQLTYFDFVLVGLLGMALMNSAIMGVAVALSKYREDKILKRLMTTPLRPAVFISAEVAAGLVVNMIQVTVILLVGVYVFGAHLPGNIAFLYPLVILGGILFQLMGFTIAGFARSTRAAEGMSNAIAVPMMFLSGIFFQLDQMPQYLATITRFLPLSPLLRMMRQVALEQTSPWQDLMNWAIVLGWIVVLFFVSRYKFRMVDD